ncbi:MAG: helix-turn-helix domain-containing protein [Chloroflexota bacterium]|nr:helix-turn-helix domain-containing protein [Chloroflexota bacterium]
MTSRDVARQMSAANPPDLQLPLWLESHMGTPPRHKTPKRPRQFALTNPVMLVWLREKVNLNRRAVSRRLRVAEERIDEWERGASRPTIPQLRKLARMYRRPLAAFYLPEPPHDFSLPKDTRRLPDGEDSEFSPALLTAFRVAEFRRDIVLELDPEPPDANFVGSLATPVAAESAAASAREMLGVTSTRSGDG